MDKTIKPKISVCWLRRDLRLYDNAALYHALKGDFPVLLIFIFDQNILEKLTDPGDKRVQFIHDRLEKLNSEAAEFGSSLITFHNLPKKAFQELLSDFDVAEVFTNHDYEPYAIQRDQEIGELLAKNGVGFHSYKDQVIWEKNEILKPDGKPYTVFTPYSRQWKLKLVKNSLPIFPSEDFLTNLFKMPKKEVLSLKKIGFIRTSFQLPEADFSEDLLKNYHQTRNLPAVAGTSFVGIHLRFGTLSVRELVRLAKKYNEQWLNELIWREFFMMILYQFPKVQNHNFKSKYDRIQWRNNEEEFLLWCKGETGYPLVDAGMRQLNQTGWMHNRVRMVVAGFLCKHLLIDWRWGEAYFAEKLLDYELASNNGNWQWAAGTGCDAAPYFRIFNPSTQLKKFDPKLEYVKKWIPNITADYLPPIVEHSYARARALEVYRQAINS